MRSGNGIRVSFALRVPPQQNAAEDIQYSIVKLKRITDTLGLSKTPRVWFYCMGRQQGNQWREELRADSTGGRVNPAGVRPKGIAPEDYYDQRSSGLFCFRCMHVHCMGHEHLRLPLSKAVGFPSSDATNGKRIYNNGCNACHGSDGRGASPKLTHVHASRHFP